MFSIISLSVTVVLLSSLSEQSSYPGPCSTYLISAVQSFLPVSLAGKLWYLIATDDEGLPYHTFDCIRFSHALAGIGYIKTTEYAKTLATDKLEISTSSMEFSGLNGNYIYAAAGVPSQPTKIVLTDSFSYYVEISCVDEGGEAKFYVGIFSISPTMSTATLNTIYKFLEDRQIKTSNLRFVEQIKCV